MLANLSGCGLPSVGAARKTLTFYILKQLKFANMKKSIATQLRKLAQELPALVDGSIPHKEGTERKTTGRQLLESGFKTDQPINPAAGYLVKFAPLINHYDRLKEAYKAEGKLGIAKYQRWVNAVVLISQRQEALEASTTEPAGSDVPADKTEETC